MEGDAVRRSPEECPCFPCSLGIGGQARLEEAQKTPAGDSGYPVPEKVGSIS